jgi:hypothetical protein
LVHSAVWVFVQSMSSRTIWVKIRIFTHNSSSIVTLAIKQRPIEVRKNRIVSIFGRTRYWTLLQVLDACSPYEKELFRLGLRLRARSVSQLLLLPNITPRVSQGQVPPTSSAIFPVAFSASNTGLQTRNLPESTEGMASIEIWLMGLRT